MKKSILDCLGREGISIRGKMCRTRLASLYRARQGPTDLVLKVAREQLDKAEDRLLANALIRHEWDIRQNLGEHPNIGSGYRLHETSKGEPAMSMHYIDGASLVSKLARLSSMPGRAILAVLRDAAEGILYLHKQGILHLDIKPGNIMVREHEGDLEGVVIDLSASNREGENYHGVIDGCRFVTSTYAAPEQFEAETPPAELTRKTDSYQLGATITFALTGEGPYKMRNVKGEKRPNYKKPNGLVKANPRLSETPELVLMLERARDREPDKRPDVDEITDVLNKYTVRVGKQYAGMKQPARQAYA